MFSYKLTAFYYQSTFTRCSKVFSDFSPMIISTERCWCSYENLLQDKETFLFLFRNEGFYRICWSRLAAFRLLGCMLRRCIISELTCSSHLHYETKITLALWHPQKNTRLCLKMAKNGQFTGISLGGFRSSRYHFVPVTSTQSYSKCQYLPFRPAQTMWVHMSLSVPCGMLLSHTVKEMLLEVGCPFPTGSAFQWLEIPQCTKRPDMIPQYCRQGREPRQYWYG